MNTGLHQTGPTCWFNSSLNIFLTSDNGLKIFWQKLQSFYRSLGPKQRAYFESDIAAVCPYKGGIQKTSQIFFWKFLNQYICAMGGPGKLIPRSGLNAYLTKNIKWKVQGLREAKGLAGGWPARELEVLLKHLGFKHGKDFRVLDFEKWKYQFRKPEWTPPILMYRSNNDYWLPIPFTELLLEKRGYELTAAILWIRTQKGDAHVWACTIRNGNGYITNSNNPLYPVQCKWWVPNELTETLADSVSSPYKPAVAKEIGFELVMYTRKAYTSRINMVCKLPKEYRPMTPNTSEQVQNILAKPGVLKHFKLGGKAFNNNYHPLAKATAARHVAGLPVMPGYIYNDIFKKSTNFHQGMALLNSYNRRLYRVNKEGQNFKNFRSKLIEKFGQKPNKKLVAYFLRTSATNQVFLRRLREYANRAGMKLNNKNLAAILARRASTRAGVKKAQAAKEDRVYRVGSREWVNNQGNNVTNRINTKNWVKTANDKVASAIAFMRSYELPVTTYRRRSS